MRRYLTRRMALRAAICVALTILVALVASYLSLSVTGKIHIEQSDFLVYYAASHLVLLGHGIHIYDFSVLRHTENGLLHLHRTVRKEAVFLYPPFVALVLAPVAVVPYTLAYVSWIASNCALLVASVIGLWYYGGVRRGEALLFFAAAFSFFPVFAAVVQGQISMVILGLLTAAFLALRAERDGMAGLLLACALIKPPYLIPLLIVLVIQRRLRAIAGFFTGALVLWFVPLAVLGWQAQFDYVRTLRAASQWHNTGGFSPSANENLWGFAHLLVADPAGTVVQVALSLAALALVGTTAWRAGRLDLPFGVAVCAAVLINPHVLLHDLSLLLIPSAIAVHFRESGPRGLWALLLAGYVLVLAGFRVVLLIPIQLSVLVTCALAIWCVVVQNQITAKFRQDAAESAPGSTSVTTPIIS